MNVELIAATYIRFPSFEKWMSCGRHSPFVSAPAGVRMTTHCAFGHSGGGQRSAVSLVPSMNL